MLSVKDHLAALFFDIGHRFSTHGQVFIQRTVQHIGYMHVPRFPDHGNRRGFTCEQSRQTSIIFGLGIGPACAAERNHFGIGKVNAFDPRKEFLLFGIALGIAPLDIVNPEFI